MLVQHALGPELHLLQRLGVELVLMRTALGYG